jgi:hypothetical protein
MRNLARATQSYAKDNQSALAEVLWRRDKLTAEDELVSERTRSE